MRKLLLTVCGIVCVMLVMGCSQRRLSVSAESLLSEMVDLKGMAEFPCPPYTGKQFSSYDRKSTGPDNQETWFANMDCGQYLRVEEREGRKEYVMMDVAGPGAIVRIWSANPEGVMRVYLDGHEIPVLEVSMATLLSGKMPGVPVPIAGEASRGWNSYFPIPYAKHCKVTSDKDKFYYHVNYRTYPEGTKVVSFAKDQLEAFAKTIEDVNNKLASPRQAVSMAAACEMVPFDAVVEPGKTSTLLDMKGPGAIRDFVVKTKAGDLVQALRHAVVRMSFDGEQTVESPLGDFFGAAPGINAYESLPLGVTQDGEMWCHWVMPFARSAKIEIVNMGEEKATVTGSVSVDTTSSAWTNRSMHFHAKWRGESAVKTRPMIDWNYMTATGQGVFAGVAFTIASPVKEWWGEGDEKIYVDGETFPSTFGTGTEDYFGYAWGSPDLFVHAYHNQPRCDGPGNYGHTSLNRWHIIDCIPFTKDFKFDMELWHWNPACTVDLTVVSYWYAKPGAKDGFRPLTPADLKLDVLPPYIPKKVKGAIEGEEFRIITRTGIVEPQDIGSCSNDRHMYWREGKVGDKLILGFTSQQAGAFKVHARFVRAVDYGIVQVSINGKKAGEPIDLYNNGVVVSDQKDLGTFDLKQGENEIMLEIVGANPQALKKYMAGLDYLILEPVK